MNTLRWSVTVLTLITVSAAVALLLAPKRGAGRRDGLLRWAAKARRTVGGRVTKVVDSASGVLPADGPLADGTRADDLARSQDMVAEGGPVGA